MFLNVAKFALLLIIVSCSTKETRILYNTSDTDVVLYNKGLFSLKKKEFEEAIDIFNELELQHPYSEWASRGLMMSGFAHYSANQYDEAIITLSKFIELNPNHDLIPYAMYLKAYCYFERIPDVKLDQKFSRRAFEEFSELTNRFPESKYSKQSLRHLNKLKNHLAAKEIKIGKFYQSQGYYLASIKRYKNVLKEYKKTIHIPESIFRLIESYLSIGLAKQSYYLYKILNYNFPKTQWAVEASELVKKFGIHKNLKRYKKKQLDIENLSPEDLDLI